MFCDILLKNANIVTMSPKKDKANWIAIKGEKIIALGTNGSMPKAVHTYDLNGRTVLPGFIDSHCHGTLTGEFLKSADLNTAKDAKSVVDAIAEKMDQDSELITAGCFSKEGYAGKMFTAQDLDEISTEKVILIYDKSYHGCYLNSKGLEQAGVSPGMVGVEMVNGKMTGEINDDSTYYPAISNIMRNVDENVIKGYMRAVNDYALSIGITTIHSLDGGDYKSDMPTWITWKDHIDLQVVNYWETLDVDKALSYDLQQVGGCICLDGTRLLRTMALFEPYYDDDNTRGVLYYNDLDVLNFIRKADSNNLQCAMHATGPRAIDQYLYLIRQVIKENGQKDLRHRIEHFSFPTEQQIEMAVDLGLAFSMQPFFSKIWDDEKESVYEKRFGKTNAKKVEPIADIIKAGGIVCGGSDSPVADMDPLKAIEASINSSNPHRRISLENALAMYTVNGAWAAHEEHIKGTLEVGKNADIVVLDSDLFDNIGNIDDIHVEMTIVKGKVVYTSKGSDSR